MSRKRTSLGRLSRALRVGLIVIGMAALNIPHRGLAAGAHEPEMVMAHSGQSHAPMTDAGNLHDKMAGLPCATVCLVADRLESPAYPQRGVRGRLMRWFGETERCWVAFAPDVALRPPDLFGNA